MMYTNTWELSSWALCIWDRTGPTPAGNGEWDNGEFWESRKRVYHNLSFQYCSKTFKIDMKPDCFPPKSKADIRCPLKRASSSMSKQAWKCGNLFTFFHCIIAPPSGCWSWLILNWSGTHSDAEEVVGGQTLREGRWVAQWHRRSHMNGWRVIILKKKKKKRSMNYFNSM